MEEEQETTVAEVEEDQEAHEDVEIVELQETKEEVSKSEASASNIPNCAVKTRMPIPVQFRGLSTASLAFKKQAAESAPAATKAVAVEIPETDSIASHIKIFGGANPTRSIGLKKLGVRDIVRKYKNVEEQSQDQIAHVVRGHNDSEPRGVCGVYSLSTASRQLLFTSRRKMCHEFGENDTKSYF
ncbi:hypothetical protein BGZ80_000333 [Entomortierella chlamydospora]|uniref:Uncharacterized protein n=1 Tax=Entomortierella chlamydospora TaxID=101097 RepID=A0A9P6MT53_9FUNG|nr:hypothetical protein BGZ80_000333 [Entomortierella chlamydospora]